MSGDHAKKEVMAGGKKPTSPAKSTSHGKAPSKESGKKRRMDPLHAFDHTRVARRRRK
jgi:hypothetical protein